MRMVFAAVVVVVLTGCAPQRQMVKPGVSPEQAAQDKLECAYEARKFTAAIPNPFLAAVEQVSLENECLAVRGYRPQ